MTAARASSLFDAPPAGGRGTGPAADPRVHVYRACRRIGATCGVGEAWFCVPCAPVDFWPHKRGDRR